MTREELVEKVVAAMNSVEMRGQGFAAYEREIACVAGRVWLEEAAKVAERHEYDELADECGTIIKPSAAIRAMMPEEK